MAGCDVRRIAKFAIGRLCSLLFLKIVATGIAALYIPRLEAFELTE
jgi:hypothetical protein